MATPDGENPKEEEEEDLMSKCCVVVCIKSCLSLRDSQGCSAYWYLFA